VSSAATIEPDDVQALRSEVHLYRELLSLGEEEEPRPLLKRALGLLVRAAGARLGYLEIRGSQDRPDPDLWIGHADSTEKEASFRSTISTGVISEAVATRRTVVSASALEDKRFRDRRSVRQNGIEAILCAPIGRGPLGVVYLQDRIASGAFSDDDCARVETVARHIAPYVERLLLRLRLTTSDPTAPFRSALHGTEGMVGHSQALAEVLKQVTFVASHEVTVLLTGPTGTGKTVLARVIHQNSRRATGPLVEINCGALPEQLIENELFGAVAGAHATANRPLQGKVAAAENGTLFLDEVGELPLAAQVKLLQLLQSGEYFPLGSSRPKASSVRVIAATNRNLEEAVEKKAFREDLFHRLNVMPLRVPGLDERADDIQLLAMHLCQQACRANRLPMLRLSPSAVHALETADWPGNVRQLENCVTAAALRAAGEVATEIEPRHIFPQQHQSVSSRAPLTYQEHMAHFRGRLLERVLEETEWNVSEAARRLDVKRSYVYKLIAACNLQRRER
jgi:Nif-specific regulatory protein